MHARAERGASSVRHGALRDRVRASPAGPLVLLIQPTLWAGAAELQLFPRAGAWALHWKSWGCKLFPGLSFLSLRNGTLTIHVVTDGQLVREEVPYVTQPGLRT